MKKNNRKKKSIIRKIVKIIFILFIIFIAGLFALSIYLNFAFPPDRIKQEVTSLLSAELDGRPVTIENLSFNLFNKLEIRNLIIFSKNTTNTESEEFVTIDEVTLHYRLLSLLNRVIKIHKIRVNNPSINLVFDERSNTHADDIIASEQQADSTLQSSDTLIINTPLSLDLNTFEFNNFTAALYYISDKTRISGFINNFTIHLNDVSVPKGDLDNLLSYSTFDLSLLIPEKSNWIMTYDSIESDYTLRIKTTLASAMDVQMNGLENISSEVAINIENIEIDERHHDVYIKKGNQENILRLATSARINARSEEIWIDRVLIDLFEQRFIDLSGSIRKVAEDTLLDLNLTETQIDLHRLKRSLENTIPAIMEIDLNQVDIRGNLIFRESELIGPLSRNADKELTFNPQFVVDSLSMIWSDLGLSMLNWNGDLIFSGRLRASQFLSGYLESKIRGDRFVLSLDDTSDLSFDEFEMTLTSDISEKYYPENLRFVADIKQFLGGTANLTCEVERVNDLNDIIGELRVQVVDSHLEDVPDSPIMGLVNGSMGFDTEPGRLSITVMTDSLYFVEGTDRIVFPPVTLNMISKFEIDENFKFFTFDSIGLAANDFLKMKARVNIRPDQNTEFQMIIDSLIIHHSSLYRFVPAFYKEGIHDLRILGETMGDMNLQGILDQESNLEFDIDGRIVLDAAIAYEDIKMNIPHLKGDINFLGDENAFEATSRFLLDDLTMRGVRTIPVDSILIDLSMNLDHYNRMIVDHFRIDIPDMAMNLNVRGIIGLDSTQTMDFKANAIMDSPEPISMVDDLYVSGKLGLTLNLKSVRDEALFHCTMNVNGLNASYLDQAKVADVNGRIDMIQGIDLKSLSLLDQNNPGAIFSSSMNYLNYDVLNSYHGSTDQRSMLTIDKIEFDQYSISNCVFNFVLANGSVEIPEFAFNIYDGNARGSIYLNLGDGDLQKMTYYMKANMSRINSAKLLPRSKISGKASELNMNMEINGSGLDVSKEIDLTGAMYVTQIGSNFTDNILIALDPKQTDKSIQDTRRLLNWGYKPKLISCEVKHGYIYPEIHLSKGNFLTRLIPLNLSGGKIELARIPIKILLSE